MDDSPVVLYVGHHQSDRTLPVTSETVAQAHDANYDMVTSPITTAHFHSRVLGLLSSSLAEVSSNVAMSSTRPKNIKISALTPADTTLAPNESMNQIIGIVSNWIDLCSNDVVIYDLSRQILKLEVAYAAFCGIMNVIIPGPRCYEADAPGLSQYSRAVLDALAAGPFIQFQIWLPMTGVSAHLDGRIGDLRNFARSLGQAPDVGPIDSVDVFGSWAAWDIIRSFCKYHPRLSVALSIPRLLPPSAIQSRWFSEPIRIMTLETQTFSKNAKGYPALSKPHQALFSQFVRLKMSPWFLLCDVGPLPTLHGLQPDGVDISNPEDFPNLTEATKAHETAERDSTVYIAYLRFLQNKQPPRTLIEQFGAGYQDYLQAPLQPLTVNLESVTYEVFEKDPIKYDWYEKAIARALHDWIEQGKPTSGADGRVVVAVVGAGRGPLVTRALRAADGVDVEVDMWALEKNPNAFVLLQRHNATAWNHRVKLVQSDMRTWQGPVRDPDPAPPVSEPMNENEMQEVTRPARDSYTGDPSLDYSCLLATSSPSSVPVRYKIDILISELLGSFGDNELSPECLDGVQRLLSPNHGISIPSAYTAYLSPIAAPKICADISTQSLSNPNAAEIPYVVMLSAIDHISTTDSPNQSVSAATGPTSTQQPLPVIQPAWSFHHPNPSVSPAPVLDTFASLQSTAAMEPPVANEHNARCCSLTFPVPNRATCHGLAGYFETVLYGKVELSTNPNTMEQKSDGMISWFPIYFPLKTPMYVPDNSELIVNMWRQTDDRKVWYEWQVDAYAVVQPPGDSNAGSNDAADKGKERATSAVIVNNSVAKRRIRIGGSELHSSIKEGCLM